MYAELQISYHRGCYDNYEGPPDEMDHMAQRCFDQLYVVTIATELKGFHYCAIALPKLVGEVRSSKELAKEKIYKLVRISKFRKIF